MRRRRLIMTMAGSSIVGLSGCLGSDDDGSGGDDSSDGGTGDDGSGGTTDDSQSDGTTETLNLRVGSFTTEESFIVGAHSFVPWIDKLDDKLENYNIEYEFLGAGAAGGGGELYDLAADGVVDLGIDQPSYQGGRLPLNDFIALPGLFEPTLEGHRSACQALHDMATPGGSSDMLTEEFSNVGVRPILSYTDQPFQLGTTDKITDIGQLDGRVVRTGGGTKSMTGEALGLSPTQVTAQDIHTALQTGTVEVEMTSIPAPWAFGWYDVLNYYTTNLNLGGFHCTMVIGENTLEDLPSEVSDAMIEAGDETVAEYASRYQTALDEEVIPSENVAEQEPFEEDTQYYIYETEARDAIEEATAPVIDEWIQGHEDDGLPAEEVVSTFESLKQEYSNN